MSKEYIEREKALEKVIEVKHYDPELSGVVLHRYIKEIDLKDIPAADVTPVVHGRWIEYPVAHYFKCSNCKYTVPYRKAALLNGKRSYTCCPHCHAVMD